MYISSVFTELLKCDICFNLHLFSHEVEVGNNTVQKFGKAGISQYEKECEFLGT